MAEQHIDEEGNIDDADGYNHVTGEVLVGLAQESDYGELTRLQPSQVELLGAYRGVRFSGHLGGGLAVSVRMLLEVMTFPPGVKQRKRFLRVLVTASRNEELDGRIDGGQVLDLTGLGEDGLFNGYMWRSAEEKNSAEETLAKSDGR